MSDLLDFGSPALIDLLPDQIRDAFHDEANPIRYSDGQLIHQRGDIKPGLSIVKTGNVRFGNSGSDGSYVTTAVLGEGQCFGEFTLFAKLPRTHDAVALGETVIDQIDAVSIDKLLISQPELYKIMLVAITKRLHAVMEFMDDLRRLPLKIRLAKMILSMNEGSKELGVVKATQSDLAFALGVTRVSIGTALGVLQDNKLIRIGYGQITILDLHALESWVESRAALYPVMPV